ncbi:MAG: XRE family transcriptional regulator [Sulfuritalea sp.]|jgi:predicted XRE-type DNA-binding protein|nr:XRE family transcriptional regulator [Sulfuritalea sp.]
MSDLTMTRGSGNVFADLGFDAEEAQNLQMRSQAMMAVENWYKASGLTQAKAAQALGITQPRLNQLLKGKIGEFSLDALVNMATRAGMRVGLTIKLVPGRQVARATAAKKSVVQHKSGQVRRVA